MTLDEFVNSKNDDDVMFIGSGSSFFFIGTKDEYSEEIAEISKRYYESSIESHKKLVNKLYSMQNNGYRIERFEGKKSEECEIISKEKFFRKLTILPKLIRQRREYIETFVPLNVREVISVFDKSSEKGQAVKITGNETGMYWTYDEYKDRHNIREYFSKYAERSFNFY